MVKFHAHHVLMVIIPILLVNQIVIYVLLAVNAVMQLLLQLNVKSVHIVMLEKFLVQHVLLVIIRL